MIDYADLQTMAAALLAEFDGRTTPLQIQRTSGGSVSSITGAFSGGSTTTYNVVGIITNRSETRQPSTDDRTGDMMAVIDYQVEPLIGDVILVDGITYQSVDVQPVKPGGVVLIYKVFLKR